MATKASSIVGLWGQIEVSIIIPTLDGSPRVLFRESATDTQKAMVTKLTDGLVDGRKTQTDARAAVALKIATDTQMAMVTKMVAGGRVRSDGNCCSWCSIAL